ncbi:MAG TPA: DEAD/DEAH box helicase [Bacteroidales bacterium]|nr:DEAD/DEAH box helicase [Bacteroidales bacterium]
MTFSQFNFDKRISEAIEAVGYDTPTPVQEKAIPTIMSGRDMIASAQTGTGKTAAFLLPIIQQLLCIEKNEFIHAVVIVPTRELAVQIGQHITGLAYYTGISSISVYGGGDGSDFAKEESALQKGTDIVVCTPGRMLSHLSSGKLKLSELKFLVLDEADRMLDMGFYDDILRIVSYLPAKRQTLMFSATMPVNIRRIAKQILKNPFELNIAIAAPPEKIEQCAYMIPNSAKKTLIRIILQEKHYRSVLIFCSTKSGVKELTKVLHQAGLNASEIHSDLEQSKREEVLLAFRNRKIETLVATDVLSRGIDVDDIELVVNYDVPSDAEDYVHRIGRTARAESTGIAITLVGEKDRFAFSKIEKLIGKKINIREVPDVLGISAVTTDGHSRKSKHRFGKQKHIKSRS